MEFWKGFTGTQGCRVFSVQIENVITPLMFKIGVTRFSHDDTDILLYKAFMRNSVLSSAPALLFPINRYFTITWAVSVSHFTISVTVGFFSVSFWATEHRPADPQLSDTEEIVIWDETPLITLTSQPTHTDKPPPAPHSKPHKTTTTDILWPTTRLLRQQGNKLCANVPATLKLRTPSQDIKQTHVNGSTIVAVERFVLTSTALNCKLFKKAPPQSINHSVSQCQWACVCGSHMCTCLCVCGMLW